MSINNLAINWILFIFANTLKEFIYYRKILKVLKNMGIESNKTFAGTRESENLKLYSSTIDKRFFNIGRFIKVLNILLFIYGVILLLYSLIYIFITS